MHRAKLIALALSALPLVTAAAPASAQDIICDSATDERSGHLNCRQPLLDLINNEPASGGIDVGFWFMEDARYSGALANAAARGVKIRVLFDSDALDPNDPNNLAVRQFVVDQLRNAGIPMVEKTSPGITHWKMMLFAGQRTVQFSGGNFTDEAFVPRTPYANYVDEVIYYTTRQSIVESFMRAFDDAWSDTEEFSNYANVTSRARKYPLHPIDPELQFYKGFRERSLPYYNAETQSIDAIIYRITDRAHTDALIEAVKRGVRIRLITEPHQYTDASRLWHRWNVDRLYVAGLEHKINGEPGVQIRHRKHDGLTHEKLTILHGQRVTVFGSSNWTSASSDYQLEHNLFTRDANFYAWSVNHFERKWNNLAPGGIQETQPFAPLGPDAPVLQAPANGAAGQAVSLTLHWSGGDWSHKYDVFLGTNPSNLVKVFEDGPLEEDDLGPYDQSLVVTGLSGGTTYYWRVVGKTMANLTATSQTWSFTTAGTPSNNAPPVVAITSPANGSTFTAPATIAITADAQDPDGTIAKVEFYRGSTFIGEDLAAPFQTTAGSLPAGTYSLTARAIDNGGATTTSSAVTVTVTSGSPTPLPSPWAQQDVGSVGLAGSGGVNGGTWTVAGSGADVWGQADEFHYVYRTMAGNGSIVARVTSVEHVDQWTKAGVMIRESLSAGSPHAFMIVTPGGVKGLAFQRRTAANGASTHTSGGPGTAPKWVKLTRSGSTITAFFSDNGVSWTPVGSDTFTMGATVHVGLAVSSHNNSVLAAATFDNVEVLAESAPPPNSPPSVTLTSPASGSTFQAPATVTLNASASDTDGSIARVDFLSGSTVVGSDNSSPYSVTLNNLSEGTYTFAARATDNAGAATTSGPVTVTVGPGTTPSPLPSPWASRDIGGVGVAGNASASGGTWTVRGSGSDVWGASDQFHFAYQPLTGNVRVVARVAAVQNVDQWTKAGVMIRGGLTPEAAHAFMLVTPSAVKGLAFQRRTVPGGSSAHTGGSAGTVPIWVGLVRTGNTIAAYESADGNNWTFVGSDTFTLPETVYVGLAVTSHNNAALAAATFDNVSATAEAPQPPPNSPPTVSITSPANGATFAAPATIVLNATAADSDGSVARVEFYAGATPLGPDATSPYSVTWSNVAAGTYTLTARAIDNSGAESVSAPITVQVTGGSPGGLPSGWSSADVGAVAAAGSASGSGDAFTVQGSGADIWDVADEFRFAYRQVTGDVTITARVDAVDFVHQWSKAGVMIRASLAAGSRHAMMIVSAGKGLAFQRRAADGALSTHTAGPLAAAPMWVRLERRGSTITAFASADGSTWNVVGVETIDLPSTVYVGLPVTSHTDGALATARFSAVSVGP